MNSHITVIILCFLLALAHGAKQIGKDYSFSYSAGDSARSEVADEDGQVQGSYSYISDDGSEKNINYIAGEETGFAAEGDDTINVPQIIANIRSRLAAEGRSYQPTEEELASWANADRSYSLSYHAGDSARTEVSNPDGYVTGRYSYLDRDGNERVVEYEAGAGIGFRVKGEHINEGISDSSVRSAFESTPLQLSAYTTRSGLDREPARVSTARGDDGSYTYSYQASDHSRTETVGPYGDIEGSYTYIGDDGQEHTINYVSGRGVGFAVSGDSLRSGVTSDFAAARQSLSTFGVTGGRVVGGAGSRVRGGAQTLSTSLGGRVRVVDDAAVRGAATGSRAGATRYDVTRTVTTRRGQDAAALLATQQAGLSGSGRVVTRTQTHRGRDAAALLAAQQAGLAGSGRVTTRTQTHRGQDAASLLGTGITGSGRVVTRTQTHRGQDAASLLGAGLTGSGRVITRTQTHTIPTQTQQYTTYTLSRRQHQVPRTTVTTQSQTGALNRLLGLHGTTSHSGSGVLATLPGGVRTVTTETRRITPGVRLNLLTTPHSQQTVSGTRIAGTSQHNLLRTGVAGPGYISFSTPGAGAHHFNID